MTQVEFSTISLGSNCDSCPLRVQETCLGKSVAALEIATAREEDIEAVQTALSNCEGGTTERTPVKIAVGGKVVDTDFMYETPVNPAFSNIGSGGAAVKTLFARARGRTELDLSGRDRASIAAVRIMNLNS